jgi:plastocyanin
MRRLLALPLIVALAACQGESATPDAQAAPPTPAPAAEGAAMSAEPLTPDADGKVITIKMLTAPDGANVFQPANFEAHQGDVLHFVLETGVHNVHFVADSNKTLANPPKASDMLQLPGQSVDLKVTWEPGSYFFQCDPHALLGMVGRVKVEKKGD